MNLLSHHERAKASKGKRDYLTIDEVKRLIATPCKNNTVKNAYLFACNCGLRLGDVRKLKWGDITQDNRQMDTFRHHEQERKANTYTARRAGKKMDTRM